jgi:Tol biopolymer transport system component
MQPAISADGRYVVFPSAATNLVGGDTNGFNDIFLRDRQNGTTELVSVSTGGAQADDHCDAAFVSADGRFVVFVSIASSLVAGDTNGGVDVFLRDRQLSTTERISVGTGGVQSNGLSGFYLGHSSPISADGRYVVFNSDASNLVGGDTNGYTDVFLRDRLMGTTELVSVDSGGVQGTGSSLAPCISADGRFVAFWSYANNLVPADVNPFAEVFVRDRQAGTTEMVSLSAAGQQGDSECRTPSISADGRYVAFEAGGSIIPGGDQNGFASDVLLRDRLAGTTELVSVATAGGPGNGTSSVGTISADGDLVLFHSGATNLVAGDTNGRSDVFLRDRNAANFTSLCSPGLGGVISCPCANPPAGSGRGCDNSSGTGGAILTASGAAYLTQDTLVLHTTGERSTALSVVMQGDASIPAGHVFGQGVRCAGGTLKRLYTKHASGGRITAPDLGAGDPTISARCSALGAPIPPGERRYYLVYYRDPVVVGGCPAASTFNGTQTGRVNWSF